MADLRKLRNNTGVAQSIVYKGKQILLGPREEKLFYAEVAQAFQDFCGAAVSEVSAPASVVTPVARQEEFYIANMTGSPLIPATVKVKAVKDKRWYDLEIPNPNKEVRDLKFKMGGGQIEYTDPDGYVAATNEFPTLVVLPPYSRRKVPPIFGRWVVQRDSNSEVAYRGAVIKSRAPSGFEPDMSWHLDDMRTFLKLVNPMEDLNAYRTTSQVGRDAKKTGKDYDIMEYEVKEKLMKHLHFYLADPKFRLPTRTEFEDYKFRKSQEEAEKQAPAVETPQA